MNKQKCLEVYEAWLEKGMRAPLSHAEHCARIKELAEVKAELLAFVQPFIAADLNPEGPRCCHADCQNDATGIDRNRDGASVPYCDEHAKGESNVH